MRSFQNFVLLLCVVMTPLLAYAGSLQNSAPLHDSTNACTALLYPDSWFKNGFWGRVSTNRAWAGINSEFTRTIDAADSSAPIYNEFYRVCADSNLPITEDRFLSLIQKLPFTADESEASNFLNHLKEITQARGMPRNSSYFIKAVSEKIPMKVWLKDQDFTLFTQLESLSPQRQSRDELYFSTVLASLNQLNLKSAPTAAIWKLLERYRERATKIVENDESVSQFQKAMRRIAQSERTNFTQSLYFESFGTSWSKNSSEYIRADHAKAYRKLEKIVDTGYADDRTLSDYARGFVRSFSYDRQQLKKGDVWIDFGAGQFNALAASRFGDDVNSPQSNVFLVGVAIETSPQAPNVRSLSRAGNFKALLGKPVENYADNEIPKADLITDFFGPLSYSPDFSRVLQIYLDHLKVGGIIHVVMNSSNNHFLVGSVLHDVSEILYLESGYSFAYGSYSPMLISLRITKTEATAKAPSFFLSTYDAGFPPTRVYVRDPS